MLGKEECVPGLYFSLTCEGGFRCKALCSVAKPDKVRRWGGGKLSTATGTVITDL